MAIKTLLLHVGMHKTGTTSIQFSLDDPRNQLLLHEAGFAYLSEFGVYQSLPIYNMFSSDDPETSILNIREGYSAADVARENKKNFAILEEIVASAPEETLIISCEEFSILSEAELSDVRQYFLSLGIQDFRILLYTRQPVDYYMSLTQTYEKMGFPLEDMILPEGNGEELFLFRNVLGKFESVFTPAQISIHSFEAALRAYGSPVLHFLSAIGMEDGFIARFCDKKANESLCQESGEFLIYFNRKVPNILLEKGESIWNTKRNLYDFWRFFNIRGQKFAFPIIAQQALARNLLQDAIWLRNKTGIDYVDSLEAILRLEDAPLPASPPETYDALFDAYKASLYLPFRLLVLEFLAEKQTVSPLWKTLYGNCFRQEFRFLWSEDRGLFEQATRYTALRDAYWQIFLNTGDGFSGELQVRNPYPLENNGVFTHQEITLDVSRYQGLQALRFDPAASACMLELHRAEVWMAGGWKGLDIERVNTSFRDGQTLYFLSTEDPQIYFPISGPAEKLRLLFDICFLEPDMWNQLRQRWRQMERALQQSQRSLERTNAGLERTKDGLERTKDGLERTKDGLERTRAALEQARQELQRLTQENQALTARSEQLARIEASLPYRAASHVKKMVKK